MPATYTSLLRARWAQGSFLCVGLDADLRRLPASFAEAASPADAIVAFNTAIIDATHDLVCAYKPNSAWYEALGSDGHPALSRTIHYIKDRYPGIPVILDAKRGDIGETNAAYARSVFDDLGADCVTVHPYFGRESLEPILERADKGVIVMGANSNPGAGEFQDLPVGPEGEPLYAYVARQVATHWNALGNCGLTVGATNPGKIARVREVAPDLPLLVLGIGAQGGDLAASVHAGLDSRSEGIIVNASRAVIYASSGPDFQEAARAAAQSFATGILAARESRP